MSIHSRQRLANAIRVLSADAVQKAKSGHPGAPMGMADIAEVLWNDFLSHNPVNPNWINRDRFVLSNGHGSMLIYSLLHLSGYDLSIDDLKQFRQLHAKTPGHPEYGYAPGVETTTGPLGQGITNAVGMAIAEKALAAQFNQPDLAVIDHFTYAFMGDGCLMEGISHEACSLAGTLGLGKLIAFWDDNGISIDGEVEGWFTDDTPARFEAYGWHVIKEVDGHDAAAIKAALEQARAESNKPTLVCCRTIIGKGSPNKQGKEDCHGAPLGDDEIQLVREQLDWPHAAFEVPDDIYAAWDAKSKGQKRESEWQSLFEKYQQAYPELAAELLRRIAGDMPKEWEAKANQLIEAADKAEANVATRKASLMALNDFGPILPELLGGSADLAGSNYTIWNESKPLAADDFNGNYVYYGVREFAMAAIMNGVSLYGGFKPYGGTFLVFSDYMRNGMRMSALMKQPVTYVLTHDSIGLGEDGPTHQPIEHVSSLRMIPNMFVWRPCDLVETMVAWKVAAQSCESPTSLILSRQGLPHQARTGAQIEDIEKGAYVLKQESADQIDLIIMATGSEVPLAMETALELESAGKSVRVISMPCAEVFDEQDQAYKESVLPTSVTKRMAIEAGEKGFWWRYVGLGGDVIGMDSFGESAPAGELFDHFGFKLDNTLAVAKRVMS